MPDYVIYVLSSSAVSIGLVSLLGYLFKNILIERLKVAVKHEYDVKIISIENEFKMKSEIELAKLNNRLSAELEILKLKVGPYSEKQFEIYNELWRRLCYLKYSMLQLWDHASEQALSDFSRELEKATRKLEMAALLIEDNHYMELMTILNEFANYEIGKRSLIDYRKIPQPGLRGYDDVRKMIEDNQLTKTKLLSYLPDIMCCLRRQIKGDKA